MVPGIQQERVGFVMRIAMVLSFISLLVLTACREDQVASGDISENETSGTDTTVTEAGEETVVETEITVDTGVDKADGHCVPTCAAKYCGSDECGGICGCDDGL